MRYRYINEFVVGLLCIFFNVQKPAFAQEEVSYGVDNGRYDEYTDNKEKNGVDILEYPSYYAKGITFSDEDKGGYMPCYMHFSGDDKIVDFVPRELFTKVGKLVFPARR